MSTWGRGAEEVEEVNEDGLLEGELAQLQLRYRVMQNSFHAYKEETKRKIAKQSMLMRRLDLDNAELNTDLAKLETAQNKAKDERNVKRLSELSKLDKEYQSQIWEEKTHIKDIDSQIADVEKKIAEQRKNMGGVHNSTAKYYITRKRTAVLENRLDKAVTLFNKQLANNDKLRSEIDHLRQERAVFDNLYKKLAHELDKSKQAMSEFIRDSTEAFEQRDDARNKMVALLERSEKDKDQHELEMRELQRQIDHDNRIREFMGIKGSDRAELKAEEAAKKQKLDAEKLANADQVTIKQYEDSLGRLKEITGEDDAKAIVEKFQKREEENFALFNYVNEVNNEMESLTDQVDAVKRDIEQFQREDQKLDEVHAGMVRRLDTQIDAVQTDTDQAEANLRRVTKSMDELLAGIAGLFKRINCDRRPIEQMLGGDCGVKAKNVMVYLGQIEQRTVELLNALAYKQKKQAAMEGETPAKPTEMPTTPMPLGVTEIGVAAPSASAEDVTLILAGSEGGAAADDSRPFTQDELRQQVMRYLQTHGPPTPAPPPPPPKPDKKKKNK